MDIFNYTGKSSIIKRITHLLNRKTPLPLDGDGDPDWGTNGQFLTTDGAGGTRWTSGGGGGGGDTVTWTQIQQSGTKIAEIDINGTPQDVFAPNGGGAEILYGTVDPDVQQGNDGDLYCKYISGAGLSKIFGKVSGAWLMYSPYIEYVWDFRVSLNAINNGTAVTLYSNARVTPTGVEIYSPSGWIAIPPSLLSVGHTYELHIASLNITAPGNNNRLFVFSDSGQHDAGLVWRGATGKWGTWDSTNSWQESSITDKNYFDNSVLKIKITSDRKWHIYKDDVLVFEPPSAITLKNTEFAIGAASNGCYSVTVESFSVYPSAD